MNGRAKQVLIVGGGIAGLTLANFLQREDLNTVLIERADEWKPVGAGITLGMNAMLVLKEIGLTGQLLSSGQTIHIGRLSDERGRTLSRMDFRPLAEKYGVEAVALHRATLHDALLSALDSAKVNLLLGTTITKLQDDGEAVTVEFSDGSKDRNDLVIGADGINSQVRQLASGETPVRYSGYTCWRFMVEPDFDFDPAMTTEMWGRGKRFGIVPAGRESLYCFTTLNAPHRAPEYEEIGVDRFREIYKDFGWIVPDILRAVRSSDQLIHNDIEDVYVKEWHKGRVVLIGDAAHAMTPNMGQGAAMAMEDAYALASSLARHSDIYTSLQTYANGRRKRVDKIHRQSYNLGRIAQYESAIFCRLRNWAVRFAPDSSMSRGVEKVLGGAPVSRSV